MGDRGNVVELWPKPVGTNDRWKAAQLRITLQLVYGRPSEYRRARRRIRAGNATNG
ncbi:hypothetical protein OG225_06900 [Nocardia sp. NBC_01377]|uniref:hypothetical protein n=1 Tax=Nocardia sp. NBC_01377 TaxID=2903595 RepID=UPI0032471E1E